MKVSSINANLNSSYIYFKSNSNITRMPKPAAESSSYEISSVFDADMQNHNVKGRLGTKNYSLMINDDDGIQISGKIGSEHVYMCITKRHGLLELFRSKSGISGVIGDKELRLTCKTDCASHHITGKYGKEDIDVTLWDSIISDSSYIDGENIDMNINRKANTVSGKASLKPELLPVLTSLAMIQDDLY